MKPALFLFLTSAVDASFNKGYRVGCTGPLGNTQSIQASLARNHNISRLYQMTEMRTEQLASEMYSALLKDIETLHQRAVVESRAATCIKTLPVKIAFL